MGVKLVTCVIKILNFFIHNKYIPLVSLHLSNIDTIKTSIKPDTTSVYICVRKFDHYLTNSSLFYWLCLRR